MTLELPNQSDSLLISSNIFPAMFSAYTVYVEICIPYG